MPKGNRIPTRSREIVAKRSLGRCERCAGMGAEWHHRRRRLIKDEHQHCPCNGVWLCRKCHSWVHANPTRAIASGFILPGTVAEPSKVAVLRSNAWWAAFFCDGDYVTVEDTELAVSQGVPYLIDTFET